jgi:hypothetical protein
MRLLFANGILLSQISNEYRSLGANLKFEIRVPLEKGTVVTLVDLFTCGAVEKILADEHMRDGVIVVDFLT